MFDTINFTLSSATGFLATVIILAGIRGLAPHLRHPRRREAFHLAMFAILVLIGGAGRTSFWDVLRMFVDYDTWVYLRGFFGGVKINTVFNGFLLWGGLHLLKLLQLLVPIHDRASYSMWDAWLYPVNPRRALAGLRWNCRQDKKDTEK